MSHSARLPVQPRRLPDHQQYGAVPNRAGSGRSAHRPEIQGLRALAVLMVVVYHVWLGRVSGGVDIFLFISAFLLTTSFIRKHENGEALSIVRYWLRVFKRLLPAAVVTLVGVLVATLVMVPQSRWNNVFEQTWASLLYVQNWILASNSVDYYAQDRSGASPLQHFWSMSIQGQVFILWPILFAAAAVIARRANLSYRAVLFVGFGFLFIVSLIYSVWRTETQQEFAYFDTGARLWEFALGTLLAVTPAAAKLPTRVRIVLGWVGIIAMVSCGLVLRVESSFPGYIALWPLLAAAAIILAGNTGSDRGVDRFLSLRPLVRLGDISYALYLWHWPVLVLYTIGADTARPGVISGLSVILVSLGLAYLTTRFVEKPFHRSKWHEGRPRRSLAVIVAMTAVVGIPLAGAQAAVAWQVHQATLGAAKNNPGAAVLQPDFVFKGDPSAPAFPHPASIEAETDVLSEGCTGRFEPDTERLAPFCSQNGVVSNPARTIVVTGNSHARQWAAAFSTIAESRNWQVVLLAMPGCGFGAPVEGRSPACNQWAIDSLRYIERVAPDAAATVGTNTVPSASTETLPAGFEEAATQLTSAGIEFIAIRGNPRFSFNMLECVIRYGEDAERCEPPVEKQLAPSNPLDSLSSTMGDRFHVIDMTQEICPQGKCPGVIGKVYVYFDHYHLSQTYIRSMTPQFEEKLRATLPW